MPSRPAKKSAKIATGTKVLGRITRLKLQWYIRTRAAGFPWRPLRRMLITRLRRVPELRDRFEYLQPTHPPRSAGRRCPLQRFESALSDTVQRPGNSYRGQLCESKRGNTPPGTRAMPKAPRGAFAAISQLCGGVGLFFCLPSFQCSDQATSTLAWRLSQWHLPLWFWQRAPATSTRVLVVPVSLQPLCAELNQIQ